MKTFYSSLVLLLLCISTAVSAQIPIYNSYPAASAVIFLDFDGHTVEGTSWNAGGPAFTCGPSNMTTSQVTEIYNRISEDYRPFNINVTTDSTKYTAAPVTKRIRVLFTVSNEWYGNNAGGVSYMGSFTWGDNTPAFVFTKLLGYNTKYIAEAGAHEAGHTFGLRHQAAYDGNCVKTAEYNSGTGSGETGWAPIMGVGYYRNFTLWNNGANPYGCTAYQDDLGIITSADNGFGYRTDDFSDNTGGSTGLAFTNNKFTINGVIEQNNDADAFKFSMPNSGPFHLDAKPFSTAAGDAGSNLDIKIEILNKNGVIGTYNPANLLSASIDTVLNAGNYFLKITSTGNEFAPQYASLGSYTVEATNAPLAVLPLHKLELQGTTDRSTHKLNWVIEADETVVEQDLEVATDGIHFLPLAQLSPATRAYSYSATQSGTLYYRLNVTFDNDRQYYSNITVLRGSDAAQKPLIAGNQVQGSMRIISPVPYEYVISDYSGRMVSKGKLAQGVNTIPTALFSSGFYVIQFNNGAERYVERFLKQ